MYTIEIAKIRATGEDHETPLGTFTAATRFEAERIAVAQLVNRGMARDDAGGVASMADDKWADDFKSNTTIRILDY